MVISPSSIEAIKDGSIFTAIFIKRTTGELRTMRCRVGVKKYLHGGELPYDPMEKGLIPVYDIDKADYRTIPIDAIKELHHHGKKEKA